MNKKFLTAEWNNLIMANYLIDPAVLMPYLPANTELDLYNGECYVSLIGFMFEKTKILGLTVPFHVNFEEINLRFYVRVKMEILGNVVLFLLKKLSQNLPLRLSQILCTEKNMLRCQPNISTKK